MRENKTDIQGGVDFVGDLIKRRIERYCHLKEERKTWGATIDAQVDKYMRDGSLARWRHQLELRDSTLFRHCKP
jgi:hypothetical protein